MRAIRKAKNKKPQTTKIVASTLVAALLGASLALFVSTGQNALDAGTWPAANGRILASEVKVGCGKGGNQHYPSVRYSYYFAGKAYEGHRIAIDTDHCGWATTANEVVHKFPVGHRVTVHVDPERPANSSLTAGQIQKETTTLLVVLSMAIVGSLAGAFWLWRSAA